MIHIKRNICLVAVSCTLLAGIPLQGVAQTGRTAKVQATQSNKITVSGTVLDKTTNDPLIGVSVVVKGVANAGTITDMDGKLRLNCLMRKLRWCFLTWATSHRKLFPVQRRN